jgi:glutathione S-transferase
MVAVLRIKETLASSVALQRNSLVSHALVMPHHTICTALTHSPTSKVAIERFRKETARVFGVIEIRLSGKYTGEPRDYLAGKGKGKYSIADIGTWAWVKNYTGSGYTEEEMKEFPHLVKWVDRIAERPAVKRGTGEKYKQQ